MHAFPPRADCSAQVSGDLASVALCRAAELGFAAAGIGSAQEFTTAGKHLEHWLAANHEGELHYLRDLGRADPRNLMPGAKSYVAVALAYPRAQDWKELRRHETSVPLPAAIARYAQGADYHRVIKDRLWEIARSVADAANAMVHARICSDTAPLLEREAARLAGLGFIGKSGMLIVPGVGTNVLLGVVLLDMELAATPLVPGGCGECTACLDACPTSAFVGPYDLDARRCVSYLTIENLGPIPRELRPGIGNRVFGCDVCQDVCPYNASPLPLPWAAEFTPHPRRIEPDLLALLHQTSGDNRRLVKRSALRRAGRSQLRRNAAVALGNRRAPAALEPLARVLGDDTSPLVRAHAAWALGQIGGERAEAALTRAASDPDPDVRREVADALLTLRAKRR